MTEPSTHEMTHALVVDAPPEALYELVADVRRWPVVFGPSVHVRVLERHPDRERFQLWAVVAGEVKNWVSRRTLDEQALRITFEQERSHPPIAAMSGAWTFRALSPGRTEVVLDHRFSVTGGEEVLATITAAVDRNSEQELAALGRIAGLGHPVDEVIQTFSDTAELPCTAADAYDFVHRSDLWPERLPHVGRVVLSEPQPGVQDMEMDTVTADGGAHTTRSIRLCFEGERIVYKQLVPPGLLFGHSGEWEFTDGPNGALVTARHTVAVDPAAAGKLLGEHSTLADAQRYLRDALGGNGRATMAHAGEFARTGGPR